MQDRFKSRCFNPDDKLMHYDDFVVTSTGFIAKLEAKNNSNTILYIDNENLDSDKKLILMQCTGLKDKNGKLIYEGDIVSVKLGREKSKGMVEWLENDGVYTKGCCLISSYKKDTEIVGNIHENPELLEV